MEFCFGVVGKDFTLLLTDGNAARSVICYQQEHDKIIAINKFNALAMSGDPGDVEQFSEFLKANMQLYSMKNDYETSPADTAHFTRRTLATAIRKKPYQVLMMIGGYDNLNDKPSLHYIGQYAESIPVPFAAHGYGAMFTNSLLDRWYRPDLSYDQCLALLEKVVHELKRRFIVNFPTFKIKKCDKNGVTDCGWMKFDSGVKIYETYDGEGKDLPEHVQA